MKVRILVCKNWNDGKIVGVIAPNNCYNASIGEVVTYEADGEKLADVLVVDDYVEDDSEAVNEAKKLNNGELYKATNVLRRYEVEWDE